MRAHLPTAKQVYVAIDTVYYVNLQVNRRSSLGH